MLASMKKHISTLALLLSLMSLSLHFVLKDWVIHHGTFKPLKILGTVQKSPSKHNRTLEINLSSKIKSNNISLEQNNAKRELKNLENIIQRRIIYVQNPTNCTRAKKLVCNLEIKCGFACQLHHVTFCLMMAYTSNRTLILKSKGWRYAKNGWTTVFQPLSNTCTSVKDSSIKLGRDPLQLKNIQVIELPSIYNIKPRVEYRPLIIPKDISKKLIQLHGYPPLWWIGQFMKYAMRLQPTIQHLLEINMKKWDLTEPFVGVHVRRTDKIGKEADYHALEEYMIYVKEYFNNLKNKHNVRRYRVFLASDDSSVLKEAKLKYPEFTFMSNMAVNSTVTFKRNSISSLYEVILDIYMLSMSNYLVCTLTSGMCRAMYEMMQTVHGDGSKNCISLDYIYFFPGQQHLNLVAKEHHTAVNLQEIALSPGDIIKNDVHFWNGYSKGINTRTNKYGKFPSYKTEHKYAIVNLPTYPEAQ